nr:hypothetical protein [Nitrosomonas nitrosa]
MSAPRYIELTKRGSDNPDNDGTSSSATWTCKIDGGLTLNPGDQIQVAKSYIHVPGSSQIQQSGIVLTRDMTATITFCYGARYLLDAFVAILKDYMIWTGSDPDVLNTVLYVRNEGTGELVKDTATITLPSGTYTNAAIAESISNQLRAYAPGKFFDEANTLGLPATCRPADTSNVLYRAFNQRQGAAAGIMALYTLPTGGRVKSFTPADALRYYIGCDQPTLVWDEEVQRYQMKQLHSQIRDLNGDPGLLRCLPVAGGEPVTVGSLQFISVTDWGFTEDNWDQSIWSVLGFTYADLGAPAAASETGMTTQQLADSGVTASNGGTNIGFWDPGKPIFVRLNDSIDQTDGPYASRAPSLNSGVGGYWRVNLSLTATDWRTGDGKLVPSVFSLADRSYSSGDVFVGEPGPTFPYISPISKTIGQITVSIEDPVTGDPDTNIGPESAVLVAIYPAAPEPTK